MSNDDLSGNGNNPYSNGSPSVDGARSSDYPNQQPYPYHTNLPVPQDGNPFSGGVPGQEDISAGLDRIVRDVATRQPSPAPSPTAADYNRDAGLGSDGNGRS